ncbi:hypothetical protein PLICRDRAFT_702060 [Plicaturopsis crispa FD-325 SS-3]|uniref:Unplaced genomic scaffold PLICRscaffold_19, whole genome shotgun sequence n=1 Tax=Plicaturopsis crispa FD-325 SS-3 TaxID=944288 RepID=A0A0C9T471_PLICR|nr:hypothetical protein PLICRDRAFT_702060 [Plicaturopsis crispa FD-325 SS-3]
MESISRLRTALLTSLNPRGPHHGEKELFDELMVHTPRLLALFDVGPRSQQEQREIESGKTVVHGKSLAVNADFARQVVFLSQQLDCSERYAAEVLHTVMTENPNINVAAGVEAAIIEFHHRRRCLVDCLRYLFEAAEAAEAPEAQPMYARIDAYVRKQLIPGASVAGGEVTLAHRIFREIDVVGNAITTTQNARQNAGSNTAQGGLGYDILTARIDSLKYERRYLAYALFLISRLGYLSPNDIQKLVDWLAATPNHPMTYHILAAALAAFDPAHPDTNGGALRHALAKDTKTTAYMTKTLSPTSTAWKDPGLKAVVLLKWTLFLTEARHRDPTLEHRDGFKTEELETQVWNAVQGGAFTYLAIAVYQFQRQRGIAPPALLADHIPEPQHDLASDELKLAILSACETLIRSLITHASSELRKIKQRQEDLVLASARTDRTRMFRSATPAPEATAQPRSDIAMLYCFIGITYSSLPIERALQFWGSGPQSDVSRMSYLEYIETTAGKLPAFLQWAVWSTQARDVDMSMALYDMLAGLAKGQQCSELAYNFLARGGGEVIAGSMLPSSSTTGVPAISWTSIFGLLESWAGAAANPRAHQAHAQQTFAGSASQHQQQQFMLGPKDVLLAQSFLRLLSTVVSYSVAVRVAISGHAHFRAIPTLVSLIPLGVPLELKGALFETLAAFCEPGAGAPGVEICKAVWTLMERLEVINVRTTSKGLLPPIKGVEMELEEVEAVYKMYPATIPFLKLLSTLIHTPKRIPLKGRVADTEPINTTPEGLGQPYRLPGIGPFVQFVVDNVFAKIPSREYLRPSDRWQTNDLCLCFIERALASYDLESLVSTADDAQLKSEVIVPLLVHPGYDLVKRLLTATPLQASILSYVVDGVEGFDKGFAEEEHFFESTIVRVLRIVQRLLDIQDIFIDVLIPLLSEFDSAPLVGTIYSRSYFTRFDQALSYGPQFVPAIAAYVAFPGHSELVLLAVKILSTLASSTAFTNLTALIENSSDSDRVLSGFRQLVEAETMADVSASELLAEQTTGAGAPDALDSPEPLDQAIRLAALDFFIHNTGLGRPYPNLAHYILLGSSRAEQQIQDPHALGAQRTSIHVILDLLNSGVPRVKGKGRERDRRLALQVDPLFVTLPALAERCYHVIYQLCVHPRTSSFTMRYLRTREDFFARQLAAVPSIVPATVDDPSVEVVYSDGSRVATTVPAFTSFLRLRSWIVDLVALDLHVLTAKGQHKSVAELLDILFGGNEVDEDPNGWEDDLFQPFQDVGQSSFRIIEVVQSLNFDWSDSLSVKAVDLQLLGQLNLHSCVRTDGTGCEIVDRSALLSLLTMAKRALHAQGRIVTAADLDRLNAETTYILESCAVENHRREVQHATAIAYDAWRRLLDITLMKCFSRLPHDRRESMLFDLLHVLPTTIRTSPMQDSTAVLLSEVILSSVTKLREDRRHQVVVQASGGDAEAGSLPAERLFAILRSILECILDNNHLELVRGNLYAALINYLHLIAAGDTISELAASNSGRSLSLALSTSREDFMFSDSQSSLALSQYGGTQQSSSGSALETGSLAIMKSVTERLIATISRDAIDGTEVWKTIAFMLLDSLVQLSRAEKQHIILSAIVRRGILSNFVRGLKETDLLLQYVLKPDPDDLNPLYVYEAKMSLFIRMAQTRAGAERLLEAQLITVLAQCDYLDARPEADQSFMDQDSFLPSAVHRYHQLFMPALQVVNGILAVLGSKHTTAAQQALEFLSSHRDTIIILLKNDSDVLPLSVIEEIHLLVSLSTSVLPLVPTSELASTTTGFGGVHGAILSLSTKCLGSGRWTQSVQPQTDAEILDASVYASGLGTETKFTLDVRERERRLRKAVVAYIGAASQFTEHEISPVLSPVTIAPPQEERSSTHFSATVPTIGDAVEALNDVCSDLADTLKQIADISAELAARDHIRVDNIQEIVDIPDIAFLQDLDIRQKRSLVCREFERIRRDAKGKAKILFSTVEMLLLILWRHLTFYSEGQPGSYGGNPPPLLKSVSARLLASHHDPDAFRAEAGRRLAPVLQKLGSLDLGQDPANGEWRSNHGYIEIMSRRLRDTAGLHDELESDMDAL